MDKKEELELGQRYYKAKESMEKWKMELKEMKTSSHYAIFVALILVIYGSYIIPSIIAGATALAWGFLFSKKRKISEEYEYIKCLMKDKNITDFIEKRDYEAVYGQEQNIEHSMESIPNMQNESQIKVNTHETPTITTAKSPTNKKR